MKPFHRPSWSGFQSLFLISSLPNRLKLLEFQVTTKASLVVHRFLPKESTGSPDTLLVHIAAIPAGVYEATLPILTLQDVPVFGFEKKVKHILPSTSVASATPRPKTCRPRDSPERFSVNTFNSTGWISLVMCSDHERVLNRQIPRWTVEFCLDITLNWTQITTCVWLL